MVTYLFNVHWLHPTILKVNLVAQYSVNRPLESKLVLSNIRAGKDVR